MGVRKADTFSGTLLASHGCPGSSAPLVPNALLSKPPGPGVCFPSTEGSSQGPARGHVVALASSFVRSPSDVLWLWPPV